MIVHFLSSILFLKIAEEEGQKKAHPLRVKKLYLLAAQLVQEHNSKMKETMKEGMSRLLFIQNKIKKEKLAYYYSLKRRQNESSKKKMVSFVPSVSWCFT